MKSQRVSRAICYFGSYDPDYSRNRIIKKGLEANGIKVLEDQADGLVFSRYIKLLVTFLKIQKQVETIIIGFPGHYDIFLAFLLGKLFRKKVYYDIFASTYETYVIDRKVIPKNSMNSKFYYLLDWVGLKLADYVIIDTIAHGKFYKSLYGLDLKKTILVYVGSDSDYFYPRNLKETTDVLFYGSYQPLQGTDVIIKAAAILPKINFKMIGEGQERQFAENLAKNLKLKNVDFVNWLSLEKLSEEIAKAKVCLGIFSKSQKANVVIPNKVFDSIASKKAVITSNNSAMQEMNNLAGNQIALVKPNNPLNLSKQINVLINDSDVRNMYATNGYSLYKSFFTPKVIVRELCLGIKHE